MKGKQTALMPGNEDKVGYWLTPPDLMAQLQAEFDFNFDACPYPRPAGFDGLKEPWGTRTWCNPPFGRHQTLWTQKAIVEWRGGKSVVLCLPCKYPRAAVETFVRNGIDRTEVRFINTPFLNPTGLQSPFKSVLILFILSPKSVHPKSDEQPPRQEARSAHSDEGGDEQT